MTGLITIHFDIPENSEYYKSMGLDFHSKSDIMRWSKEQFVNKSVDELMEIFPYKYKNRMLFD